jgi:hypothetical protein
MYLTHLSSIGVEILSHFDLEASLPRSGKQDLLYFEKGAMPCLASLSRELPFTKQASGRRIGSI